MTRSTRQAACRRDGDPELLKVIRRRPDGTKELLHTLAEGHIPDGFKLDTEGNFWITAFGAGGPTAPRT